MSARRGQKLFLEPQGVSAPPATRLSHRTRSSVTYSIADSHAIVSLANDYNLEDPPHAASL